MNKKILIIGLTYNETLGVGVTLRNLFSQIQPSQVGIIDYCVTLIDIKYAKSLFNISHDAKIDAFTNTNKITHISKYKWIERIKHTIFNLGLLSLRKYFAYYYNNYIYYDITPNLKYFVSDFKPDFIYVVPYNHKVIELALKLNNLYSIPIVTHFMDDFRKRSPLDVFYYLNEYLTKQRIKHLVNKSYLCVAICEYMAEEYQRTFRKVFHAFHNPLQITYFQNYKGAQKENSIEDLKIVYTGTIAENNYDTIILFSSICERLSTNKTKIYFDIYSPQNASNIFYHRLVKSIKCYRYTSLKNSLTHSKIVTKLFEYNLLLLPLSFKKRYYSVIEFSFPTKVSEYMASGIPTLYILPQGIALHNYIKKHEFGYLIDQLDSTRIETFLLSFINDASLRREDIRAKELAYRDFNIDDVASKFKELFI
jgi:hypothetical protein